MTPYFFIFFLNIIAGLFWQKSSKLFDHVIMFYMFCLMTLFIGFKYEVGTDHGNYLRNYFRNINDHSYAHLFPEWGYYLSNRLAGYLDLGLQFVYVICGFLMVYGVYRAASVLKVNPYYFFALVFPFHIVMLGISGVRQGVAESIFILAFAWLLVGKKGRFFPYLFVGFGFHFSIVFFALFRFIKLNKFVLIFITVLLLPVALILFELRYAHYIDSSLENEGVVLRLGFSIGVAILIWLVSRMVKLKLTNTFEKRLYKILIAVPFALLLLIPLSSTLVDRVSYYFILSQVLFFLYIFKTYNYKKVYRLALFSMVIASLLGLFAFSFFGNNAGGYQYDNLIFVLIS